MSKLTVIMGFACQVLMVLVGRAQGWVAEVRLDFNHDLYAYERITSATFTYSGVTQTGTSPTSNLELILKGTGPISGGMGLSITGMAFEPYYADIPFEESIASSFSGTFSQVCSTGFFEQPGETSAEQVYIWITVYPRMDITQFTNACDEVSFTTNTCSSRFTWEVSDRIDEGYRVITGKNAASISITRDELSSLGFSNPAGRKYFRVTGAPGTTSLIQPVDIYYPPPSATFTAVPPQCHESRDGELMIDIVSVNPAVINDFVATLFDVHDPSILPRQLSITNGFSAKFDNLAAGTYRVRIENNSTRDVYGACWSDYDLDPIIDPEPVAITSTKLSDYNGYEITCHGGADGSIEVIAGGGTGAYPTYEWLPSISTTNKAQGLAEGTYEIRVVDSNGCVSERRTVSLRAPESLRAELRSMGGKNGFDVSCHDSQDGALSAEVSGGAGGYTIVWSNGDTTREVQDLAVGTYSISVADANGCTTRASAMLTSPQPIEFSIGELSPITCVGDSTGALEVRNPVNTIGTVYYQWSTGERGSEIVNKPAGSYVVTVSDDQGCAATRPYTLEEPPEWSVEIQPVSNYNGAAIRCAGESNGALIAIVRNGNRDVASPAYYSWYRNGRSLASGPTLAEMRELDAGTYRAVIAYDNVCLAEDTFVLQEPIALEAKVSVTSNYNGVPISCRGADDGSLNASATGGTGHHTFEWSTGNTGSSLNSLKAGSYEVVVLDANGCEDREERSLEEPPPVEPHITIDSDYHGQPITCAGAADGRLSASATGGVSGYSFRWNTGYRGPLLEGVRAGRYVVTATDVNGCAGADSITVTDPTPVTALISEFSDYNGYGVSCAGARDGYIVCSASGGTAKYEFTWMPTGDAGARLENIGTGVYTALVTDQNGCTDSVTYTLTAPDPLTVKIADLKNVSCHGGDDGAITLSASGGAGGYSYAGGDTGFAWTSQSQIKHLTVGWYQPVVKDINGCTATVSENLTEPAPLVIEFQNVEPAHCGDPRGGAMAEVTGGTPDYSYRWTDGEEIVVSEVPFLSGVTAGIFTLTVLDSHGCEAIATLGITSTDGPAVRATDLTPVTCHDAADGGAVLSAEGEAPFTFRWQDGQTGNTAVRLRKGKHLVEVTDKNGCTAVDEVSISGPDSLALRLVKKEDPSCFGDCNGRITVAASGGNGQYRYAWDETNGPEVDELCAGKYTVNASDDKGCTASATFTITEPAPLKIELRSMKTPNCHDGCDGAIGIEGSGGTGDLSYHWNTGMTGPIIDDLCADSYSVTLSDDHGCMASSTYTLPNPTQVSVDLGAPIVLCKGQSHTLNAGDGWAHLRWRSSTGLETMEPTLTVAESGWYALEATTSEGCIARDTFMLETSTDLLSANFLLASEAATGDTVVMIDISWPLPEAVHWQLPPEMLAFKDSGEMVTGIFSQEGAYTVGLEALLGECRDEIKKTIAILPADGTGPGAGRLGYESGVSTFTLYPNPNDGAFDIVVELTEESSLILTVWHSLSARSIVRIERTSSRSHREHVDLRPLPAGSYTLRIDHARGTRFVRFIVR